MPFERAASWSVGELMSKQYSDQTLMTFQLFDRVDVRRCANADNAARVVCALPY